MKKQRRYKHTDTHVLNVSPSWQIHKYVLIDAPSLKNMRNILKHMFQVKGGMTPDVKIGDAGRKNERREQ